MSIVDTTTGEVVEIADADEARQLVAQASAAIAHMNVWTGKAIELLTEAYNRRVWVAEGYGSWDELVEAKGWAWKPLTSGERGAVAEVMRQKGMSLRAIGNVLASSPQTIRRDVDGEFTSDHSPVPNGTASYTHQEATDDPEPLEGDGADDADGPLGHDEGETTGEEASDTQSGGGHEGLVTPVPPAATSHPDATPAPIEGAASPSQASTTEPAQAATDASAAPSPSDDDEPAGRSAADLDRERIRHAIKAIARMLVLYTPDDARNVADPELLDSIADLGGRAEEIATWCQSVTRPQPLRVVAGGAS